MLLGNLLPEHRTDRLTKVKDYKVPGPGAYNAKDMITVPSFRIVAPLSPTKQYENFKDKTTIKNPVGP